MTSSVSNSGRGTAVRGKPPPLLSAPMSYTAVSRKITLSVVGCEVSSDGTFTAPNFGHLTLGSVFYFTMKSNCLYMHTYMYIHFT